MFEAARRAEFPFLNSPKRKRRTQLSANSHITHVTSSRGPDLAQHGVDGTPQNLPPAVWRRDFPKHPRVPAWISLLHLFLFVILRISGIVLGRLERDAKEMPSGNELFPRSSCAISLTLQLLDVFLAEARASGNSPRCQECTQLHALQVWACNCGTPARTVGSLMMLPCRSILRNDMSIRTDSTD